MGKIERLNKAIEKLEREIEICEEKIAIAKEKEENKEITKAKYNQIKMKQQTRIRSLRNAIKKKKRARMELEKKELEKKEEEKKKK